MKTIRFRSESALPAIGQGTWYTGENAALRGRRERAWLVSEVYPCNAGEVYAIEACERRLQTYYLNLYLVLHWRGNVPLEETIRRMICRSCGKSATVRNVLS